MLFQGDTASTYSMMRMPDGSFAFYNRRAPQAGPLSLPDIDGVEYTLLPYLPAEIVNSETIANDATAFDELQSVDLSNTGTSSDNVKLFANAPKIAVINISNTLVGWNGVNWALDGLAKSKTKAQKKLICRSK